MLCMVIVTQEGDRTELRRYWGDSINEHMKARLPEPMSRKELQRGLAAIGFEVSLQAISLWIRGEVSPRPETQAAIARVLGVPARSVFPLPTVNPSPDKAAS
jgi:hypothetical protein